MNAKTTGANRPNKPAPALPARQFARWIWRQLTSMRTALFLLLLLAVAAIPGSIVPQEGVDASKVVAFKEANPTLAPVLDALGMFSVYTSPWFSAIYLLLMVSLVGCFVPRIAVYAKALRSRPPKAPRNFDRLPQSRTYETEADPDEVLEHARAVLRKKRARVDIVPGGPGVVDGSGSVNGAPDGEGELRSESGYLREAGNLVFHVCLLVVLVGVAAGSLYGYRGNAIVSEGSGFSNTLTQYDEFNAGALFDPQDLPPFSMRLENFTAEFQLDGPQRGSPLHFEATGTYTPEPGAEPRPYDIEVNHPLQVDGTSVFLVGQGYAPVVKVTDGNGNVAFEGTVPFLPEDATYTSTGVVKAADAQPEQLGFQGFFLPTAVSINDEAPISAFPGAANPVLGLFAYYGDLGLDNGEPQSVFVLDKDELTQIKDEDGQPLRITLARGEKADLPDGRGSIEFVGLRQFVKFQFSASPGMQVPLWATVIGVLGLIMSLSIKPRRMWVRTRRRGTRTVVEVAALDRVSRGDLAADVDAFVEQLHELHAPARTSGDE